MYHETNCALLDQLKVTVVNQAYSFVWGHSHLKMGHSVIGPDLQGTVTSQTQIGVESSRYYIYTLEEGGAVKSSG